MNKTNFLPPYFLRYFCVCITFLFLSACGGGTSGTGGVTIDGRVLRPDGSAASGVQVIVLESGDATTSDANGAFRFEEQPREALTLSFEEKSAQGSTSLGAIPANTRKIEVQCTFDKKKNEARTDSVQVKEEDDDDDKEDDKNDEHGGNSGSSDDDDKEDGDDDSGKNDDGDDKDDKGSSSGNGDDDGDDDDEHSGSGSGGGDDDDGDDDSEEEQESGNSGSGGGDDDDDDDDSDDE